MALVTCPECGRENVSDSAESCPDCGYGIKSHFEKVRSEQRKKEIHELKLQNVEMPDAPKKMNAAYGLAIFGGIGALGGFAISPTMGLLMLAFAFWMCYEGLKQYDKELEKYNLAKSDFEKYKQEVVHQEEQLALNEALKPRCPQCNSTNIQKISTTDRAVSVAMVGVASGKIGKQYKCKNCKHMW